MICSGSKSRTFRSSAISISAHTLPAIQLDLVLPTLPIPPGASANVQVTATLLDNLPHANAVGEQTFSLGHAYVIATDIDGDVATGTVEITVKDDVPTITLSGSTPSLVVDETTFLTNDTESFAGAFTVVSGADQPVSTVYALGFNAGATGLVDTATNEAVVLSLESGAVVGRTQLGGLEVFRVTVAANGDVTLDQSRAVVHSPDTGPNQSTGLSAANLVTLTATVTDTDGDQDAETLNIGQTLTFHDDAPTVTTATLGSAVNLDETSAGMSPAGFPLSATSASAIITHSANFGADGRRPSSARPIRCSVTVAASGLSTAQGDFPITLVQTNGTTIHGPVQRHQHRLHRLDRSHRPASSRSPRTCRLSIPIRPTTTKR